MRPRQVVMCIGRMETVSRLGFVLDTRGFRTMRAESPEDALLQLTSSALAVDAMVINLPLRGMDYDSLRMLRLTRPEMKVVMLGVVSPNAQWNAEVCLPIAFPMEALIERLRILMARKRGPKKMPVPCETAAARQQGVA